MPNSKTYIDCRATHYFVQDFYGKLDKDKEYAGKQFEHNYWIPEIYRGYAVDMCVYANHSIILANKKDGTGCIFGYVSGDGNIVCAFSFTDLTKEQNIAKRSNAVTATFDSDEAVLRNPNIPIELRDVLNAKRRNNNSVGFVEIKDRAQKSEFRLAVNHAKELIESISAEISDAASIASAPTQVHRKNSL